MVSQAKPTKKDLLANIMAQKIVIDQRYIDLANATKGLYDLFDMVLTLDIPKETSNKPTKK